MAGDEPFLVADRLTRAYGATIALDHVDLAAREGTVLAVLGPNGCGKTTTVRIFATLLRADSGHALVSTHDVVTAAAAVRAMIGLAGQYAAVDPFLTGRENLELVAALRHLPPGESRRETGRLLERLGLSEAAGRLVRTYSGGMRRRLDLAAALIGHPPMLFLDEPTTGLDPRSRHELWDLISDQVAAGATVLLTTQYMEEADRLADQIAVLDRGRVIATGSPPELKAKVGGDHLELTCPTPRTDGPHVDCSAPAPNRPAPPNPRSSGSRCRPAARCPWPSSQNSPPAVHESATCRCTVPPWRMCSCT